jgi:hypothetical protein
MIVSDALATYASGLRIPDESRASTLGASEVGQCARKMFFLKNEGDSVYAIRRDAGYVDAWGAQLRGTIFERSFWVPALRARFGDRLKFAGDEQRGFESGFISATPDALLVDVPPDILAPLGVPDIGSDCLLLECKTADPRTRLEAPKPEHHYQVIVQLGVIREIAGFAPRFALLSYVDASFWSEVTDFAVEFDPAVFEHAKRRAAKVLTANRPSELAPEGWISGGHECRRCPFTEACGIERRAIPEPSTTVADPQFAAEIRDLALEVRRLESEADATHEKFREAQHQIKERLRAKGLRRVKGEDFSVVWVPVKGRQGFDVKSLKAAAVAAGVDVVKFETTGQPTDRLEIRVQDTRSSSGERV